MFAMPQLPSPITPEQITALPPEFQALIRSIVDHYERRIAALEAELAAVKKTPRNSSLPPSSEHPHAKPPRDKKDKGYRKDKAASRVIQARASFDSDRGVP